jgi:hypothetical protein
VNRGVNAWLARPETRAALMPQGRTPGGKTAAEFDAIFRRDLMTWARVVRDARVPAERAARPWRARAPGPCVRHARGRKVFSPG